MKTALVADWLPTFGGAEHVIYELTQIWPDAPLYTTVANHKDIGPLQKADVRTTTLQKWYSLLKNHQFLLPWMPRALENIDLRNFDVIVSSSHAVGKGIISPSTAIHICYCHTPMRYAWEMEMEYLKDFKIPKIVQRPIKKKLKQLRRWDLTTALRVDHFIANSRATQERIKRIYNRESDVIHPPVSERFFETILPSPNPLGIGSGAGAGSENEYYLAIGRLVPYKRFDLLIEVANELKIPLKIAGKGQDESRLKKLAGPTVEFVGFVPDEKLPALYANARALLFPQIEDAGVVPLEAQASGTPVIALGEGGALDSVMENKTGVFFKEQTSASIKNALAEFEKKSWNPEEIRTHAQKFSANEFRKKITEIVARYS